MAGYKSVKNTFFTAVLLFSLLAVVGQLLISSWERYKIRSEIKRIKTCLSEMKNTISSVDKTYDNLYVEILDLHNGNASESVPQNKVRRKEPNLCKKITEDLITSWYNADYEQGRKVYC